MIWVSVLVMLGLIFGALTVSLAAADDEVAARVSTSNNCPCTHQNKRDTGDTGY